MQKVYRRTDRQTPDDSTGDQNDSLELSAKTHLILTYLYVMMIKVSEMNSNSVIKALCTVHKILG